MRLYGKFTNDANTLLCLQVGLNYNEILKNPLDSYFGPNWDLINRKASPQPKPTSILALLQDSMRSLGRTCTRTRRILILFLVAGGLFLFEITVGYITHSLALIVDSFRMLGNEVTLIVAYVAVRMSSIKWKKSTFGLARAEVLAALINAVFTAALSFSVTIKSFERFFLIEEIIRPKLMLIAGSVGLAVNIIESFSFRGYGCSRNINKDVTYYFSKLAETDVHVQAVDLRKDDSNRSTKSSASDVETPKPVEDKTVENSASQYKYLRRLKSKLHPGHVLLRAISMHSLTGIISSVLIIISSLTYLFCTWQYKYYLDPSVSLIITLLIFCSVWSLLRDSALILLQTVPKHIKIEGIKQRLLENVDGVLAIHELHVWQLAGSRIIASVHIRCKSLPDYMAVAGKVKEFFHNEGIHSTTVQPEFDEADLTNGGCVIVCPRPNESCLANRCCAVSKMDLEPESS